MQSLPLFADSEPQTDAAAVVAHSVGSGSGVCTPKRGRRAVHSDAAARVAAHRAKQARLDYSDDQAIALTIEEIARALDQSKQDVMRSLVRFALTNRNWKQLGLYGRKGA